MDNQQLLTYAIMNVNDSNKVDYYDNFIPFVKETLRKSGIDTISANELKKRVQDTFKINIPINVINTILRNRLRPQGYIKYRNNTYYPNYEKLQDTNFQEVKQRIMEKHERLISGIITYASVHFNCQLSEETAEDALESFLRKHQITLLESSLNHKESVPIDKEQNSTEAEIIVSKYIMNSIANDTLSFEYLIEIIKGTMLTNAMYYKDDFSSISMKFKGTEVFIDSSFVIYALGLAGEARKEPCIELLDMIKRNKGSLKVFRHNIEEIIGILEYCKNNLTASVPDHHGTINNFLDKGYTSADIDRIIYSLEESIEKAKIKIIESVNYDEHQFVISHGELKQYLEERINYSRDNALERDVQSIAAIMRLRRDKRSMHIEDCRALFLTTNFNLAEKTRAYFYNEDNPRLIPPVLHDSVVTNLMWLKNPSQTPDLPRKRLIAESYAATQPKEHLWNRYIETLKIYQRTQEVTEKEITLLRYTQGARELLVEKTLGNEDAITIGAVHEILNEIKHNEKLRIMKSEHEKEEAIKELEAAKDRISSDQKKWEIRIQTLANQRAKIFTNVIMTFVALFIGTIIYFTPMIQKLDISSSIKIFVLLLFVVIPSLMGLFNINILPLKDSIYNYLTKRLEMKIRNKYFY